MWSKKYNECIQCKTTEREHQAHGLCTNCYFKFLKKNSERVKVSYKKAKDKWTEKRTEKRRIIREQKKAEKEARKDEIIEERRIAHSLRNKQWYKKNQEAIRLIAKAGYMKKQKRCLQIIINNKKRYLPFESLFPKDKELREKVQNQYDILYNYFNKTKIGTCGYE